jgi:hypothetical protein
VVAERDRRTHATSDAEHLEAATSRGFLSVTHNRSDFKTLYIAWHVWRRLWNLGASSHAGVIAIPQRTRLPYTSAVTEIGALPAREPTMWNQLWYFDLDSDDWVRQV